MKIFRLKWSYYDTEQNFFLEGPDVAEAEFLELCNKLVPEAAKIALHKNGHTMFPNDNNQEYKFQVGWNNIVEVLSHTLLPRYGYKQISLPTAFYHGTTILRFPEEDENKLLGDVMNVIVDYNKKIERDSHGNYGRNETLEGNSS